MGIYPYYGMFRGLDKPASAEPPAHVQVMKQDADGHGTERPDEARRRYLRIPRLRPKPSSPR